MKKKLRQKMKKWQIENSETSEISKELFRVFAFFLQPKSKTRIQKSWKNFPKFPRFPRFPSVRPGQIYKLFYKQCFFLNSASVLGNFFMSQASNIAQLFKYYLIEIFFISRTFVSVYVWLYVCLIYVVCFTLSFLMY